MNAMGHDLPNPLGADLAAAEAKIRRLIPNYTAMGSDGMAAHGKHLDHLKGPDNTLPMMTGQGPYGPMEMGGMFTVLKVREGIESYDDPGWYAQPTGTRAWKVV